MTWHQYCCVCVTVGISLPVLPVVTLCSVSRMTAGDLTSVLMCVLPLVFSLPVSAVVTFFPVSWMTAGDLASVLHKLQIGIYRVFVTLS